MHARRSKFPSRIELDGAQNANSELNITYKPGQSQNNFQTASLQADTLNTDSLQRKPRCPKKLIELENYNSPKIKGWLP